MTPLRERLRDADPIRHAPAPDDRTVVWQHVLLATHDDTRGAEPFAKRMSRRAVLAIACLGVAVIAAGTQVWPHGGATLQAAAVQFEARLAESQPVNGLREAPIAGKGESTYLYQSAIVSNGDIAQARVVADTDATHFGVEVNFTTGGAQKMRDATATHIGQPFAILIDGQVVAAPILRTPLDDIALISGGYTEAEAERIANGIAPR